MSETKTKPSKPSEDERGSPTSYKERLRKVVSACRRLNAQDYSFIENIIRLYSPETTVSSNNNGIFVNLNEVQIEAIEQIEGYISTLSNQRRVNMAYQKSMVRTSNGFDAS